MTYRVIQIATGSVGHQSLMTILGRPDLELVGLRVFSEAKAGLDAGEIAGIDPIGILATNSPEEILATPADCVVYNALGDTFDVDAALAEICALLRSGKNVVDTSISPPVSIDPAVTEALARSCEEGGSSYLAVGLNPGFVLDIWPITMSRTMARVDRIDITELENMGDYESEQLTHYMGFGSEPGSPLGLVPASGIAEESAFYQHFRPSIAMLERSMGYELDRFEFDWDVAIADQRIEMATTIVEPGTISAIRLRLQGYQHDVARVRFEAIYKASAAAPTGWPGTEAQSEWRMTLHGDPAVESILRLGGSPRGARPDMVMTGSHGVNAVPFLVDASPGVKTFLDLPVFGVYSPQLPKHTT